MAIDPSKNAVVKFGASLISLTDIRSRGPLFAQLAAALFTPLAARMAAVMLAIAFLAIAIVKPATDWDMLAYMAIAVEHDYATPQALHQFIFSSIKSSVSPAGWQDLAHLDAWRESQYLSAEKFVSMLGFFRMKVAYIATVGLVAKLVGIVYAPWVVSALFGLATFALFYLFLMRLDMERYFILTIPVILASDLPWLIRLPTPDSMSAFFLLLGTYLFVFKTRYLAYVIWCLAVLTRPDNIVFLVALWMVQIARRDFKSWEYLGLLAGMAIYVFDISRGGHMGWWAHFYFTNVDYAQNMNDFQVSFTLPIYLGAVLNGLVQMIYKASWFHVYLALLAAYLFISAKADNGLAGLSASQLADPKWSAQTKHKSLPSQGIERRGSASWPSIWDGFIVMSALTIGARLVVFPYMSGRLLCPIVLITLLALLALWRGQEVIGAREPRST